MLPDNYKQLLQELSIYIESNRLITEPLITLAYCADASFYRLIPKIVVHAHSEKEMV